MLDMISTVFATLGLLYLISPTLRAEFTSTFTSIKDMFSKKK